MNEIEYTTDVVDFSKNVVKNIMVKYLFEVADEVTFKFMEREIAVMLAGATTDKLSFEVNVNAEDGDVAVAVKIIEWGHETVKYVARYVDCPTIPTLEKPLRDIKDGKDETITAFDAAMEIVQ